MFQVEELQVKLVQDKIDLEKKLKCERDIVQNLEDQRYIISVNFCFYTLCKTFVFSNIDRTNHLLWSVTPNTLVVKNWTIQKISDSLCNCHVKYKNSLCNCHVKYKNMYNKLPEDSNFFLFPKPWWRCNLGVFWEFFRNYFFKCFSNIFFENFLPIISVKMEEAALNSCGVVKSGHP